MVDHSVLFLRLNGLPNSLPWLTGRSPQPSPTSSLAYHELTIWGSAQGEYHHRPRFHHCRLPARIFLFSQRRESDVRLLLLRMPESGIEPLEPKTYWLAASGEVP